MEDIYRRIKYYYNYGVFYYLEHISEEMRVRVSREVSLAVLRLYVILGLF